MSYALRVFGPMLLGAATLVTLTILAVHSARDGRRHELQREAPSAQNEHQQPPRCKNSASKSPPTKCRKKQQPTPHTKRHHSAKNYEPSKTLTALRPAEATPQPAHPPPPHTKGKPVRQG
jgi:hypothetical protein